MISLFRVAYRPWSPYCHHLSVLILILIIIPLGSFRLILSKLRTYHSIKMPSSDVETNGHGLATEFAKAKINGNHQEKFPDQRTNGGTNGSENTPKTTIPKFDLPSENPGSCVAGGIHTLSLFALGGKTALVTGANGGIGGGMATGLAEAGADIVIFQIPGDKSDFHQELAERTGRRVSVYDCDMGDMKMLRETIQRVFDDGHRIDILCNVAGISSGSIPILHETDEHKDSVC